MFKTAHRIPEQFPSSFFSICFISIHLVHPYSSMNTATAWKKSWFILLDWSDFYMIDNLPIAFHAFARHLLTSLSVDEMLVPRYENLTTNFRGLPLTVKMAPFYLKHIYSVLFAFMYRPMSPAAYFRLYRRDSTWADVYAKSTWSSA